MHARMQMALLFYFHNCEAVSHIYEQKAYAKADAKVRSTVLRMNVRYVAVIINRAKPDMRKSNAVRFPNEHGSYLPIAVSSVYTLFNNNVLIFLCLFLSYFFLGRIICL